jgi:hypothetical protein
MGAHLGDGFRVRCPRGAAMGISMRPYADAGVFGRRTRRGVRTVWVHCPRDFAPVLWERMLLRRLVRTARAREAYER